MPKESKAGFKYRGRSDESVMRRAKESAGSFDSYVKGNFLWYKSKEGENCIRIMPPNGKALCPNCANPAPTGRFVKVVAVLPPNNVSRH